MEKFFRRTTLIRETRICHLEGSINKTPGEIRWNRDEIENNFEALLDKKRLGLSEEACDGAEVNISGAAGIVRFTI